MNAEKPWVVELWHRPTNAWDDDIVARFETEAAAVTWLEAGGLRCDDTIGPDTTIWAAREGRYGKPVLCLTKEKP